VNTPATMVGEDVEVTKMQVTFPIDETNGRNLITRRLSRGVVADCFAQSKRHSIYTIVGYVGIGKSWTLIYALQQALLYENACVVTCFQKDSSAILCIRRKNCIYVWYRYDKETDFSRLSDKPNVLLLLDPRDAEKGFAQYSGGCARQILATSNCVIHFASIEKITPNHERFLSPYWHCPT
jgi:hypothetical protein